jgi:hypothetical protein
LREEIHALLWYGKGFGFSDALELTPKERGWFLKRITRQLKAEAQAMKGKKG